MSCRVPRPPLAPTLLLAALALGAPAFALDIKLWPLFRYARDDQRGLLRWSAFGPIFEYTGTTETRDLRIRPLLWLHHRRGTKHDDRAEVLYPLLSTRWHEDYQSLRLLLLGYRTRTEPKTTTTEPPATPEWTSRFSLVPFVFYRRSADGGTHLSVLPFYLDEEDVLGYDRITAIAFPGYLRLEEPGVERRFYGFPFVSTVGGALGSGVRLLPFYGTTTIAGKQETRYVMWPFHIRTRRFLPGWGWEERRIDLPAVAAIDGPTRRTRAYGVFAYTHTVDTRRGYEATGSPWPLVVRERDLGDTAYRTWRFFPFYGRSANRGITSHFYAWPAYRTKTQDVDDFHYQRRDVGLVLWRQVSQRNETSGHSEALLTNFPLLRSQRDDERRFGQVPAFADSLLPRNRGVLALWAPLYGLVRWDTRPDGALDWNAAWGLVAREDGRMMGPWYLERDPRGDADGS